MATPVLASVIGGRCITDPHPPTAPATPVDAAAVPPDARPTGQRGCQGGPRYRSTNPARLAETVAEVRLADPATFAYASRVASDAQPGWADVPAPVRGRVIAAVGRLVEDNKEALAALVTREIGKPLAESRGEVQEIIDTCDVFLGEGRRLFGQTVPSEMPDKQLFTFRDPVGVMAVITAGNFPVAVPAWYLVPALLAGNAVVWKPAEYAAASARALFELFVRAGVPAGVLNLVLADGDATYAGLEAALDAGTVHKVGFTGSTAVGARIGELCGRHLTSPCLELGGKNPMVILPDADLDLAVRGALFSGFGTAGQRCTSLGTVLVHTACRTAFTEALTAAVEAAAIGDPRTDVLYGPMLDERFAARFEGYLDWIKDHHRVSGSTALGRILPDSPREGFVNPAGDTDPAGGLFYHPVIVDGLHPDDALFTEETFGPIIGIAEFGSLAEAVELANLPGYGLSAAIYTRDPTAVFAFRRGVRAGMVSVNNSTSGAEAHLPFGGNGRSGNGSRQSGMWMLDQVTRWQAVNWDYSGHLQRAQMDTAVPAPDLGFRLPDPELVPGGPSGRETGSQT